MLPSPNEIQREAFLRWQARGGGHGHDYEDWRAAEQELLFHLNYQIAARYRLDGDQVQYLGNPSRRVCRFCEQASPRTTFAPTPRPVLPAFLGCSALVTYDECDECHEGLNATIGPALEAYLRPRISGTRDARGAISAAAFKGLVRMALLVLHPNEAAAFGDAVEWLANPDHDLDLPVLGPLDLSASHLLEPAPRPWLALARRVDLDAPLPSVLFFFVWGHLALQAALPLSSGDQGLDGEPMLVPRVVAALASGRGRVPSPLERVHVTAS
jgi:hypothetical protein